MAAGIEKLLLNDGLISTYGGRQRDLSSSRTRRLQLTNESGWSRHLSHWHDSIDSSLSAATAGDNKGVVDV